MTDREELIRAMTIALSMAIDMKDSDMEKVRECECLVCTTFKGALMIYEGLMEEAAVRGVGRCLH